MGVHPCRASQDTGGNPHYKMHAWEDGSEQTRCGLEPLEVDRRHAFGSICPSCFPNREGSADDPTPSEKPWTPDNGNRGDVIAVARSDPRWPGQTEEPEE